MNTISRDSVAAWSYLIGAYWNRNLWLRAGRSTIAMSGTRWSVSPRSRFRSMPVPTMPARLPEPELVIRMFADGHHKPADASTWYSSPTTGSPAGGGLNWAAAGAAAIAANAATDAQAYRRVASLVSITSKCPLEKFATGPLGVGPVRITRAEGIRD